MRDRLNKTQVQLNSTPKVSLSRALKSVAKGQTDLGIDLGRAINVENSKAVRGLK